MMRRAKEALAEAILRGLDVLEEKYGESTMERVYGAVLEHKVMLYALTVPVGLGLGIAIGLMIW